MTPRAGSWQKAYLDKYYPSIRTPTAWWIELLHSITPEGARVLEVGGGPGVFTARELRDRVATMVGLDIDPLIKRNRYLDAAVVYDGERFPFADSQFDVVVSSWVNEHLLKPDLHFAEIARVLCNGGIYLFRTPNLFHYKSMAARLVPRSLHVGLVRWLRQLPATEHDPYPTFFRANTPRSIKRLLQATGFEIAFWRMREEFPIYGMGLRALFIAFMGYERLVNASKTLEVLRHTIECAARVRKDPIDRGDAVRSPIAVRSSTTPCL